MLSFPAKYEVITIDADILKVLENRKVKFRELEVSWKYIENVYFALQEDGKQIMYESSIESFKIHAELNHLSFEFGQFLKTHNKWLKRLDTFEVDLCGMIDLVPDLPGSIDRFWSRSGTF